MKLMIKTREGIRICDWESYALLRDNVQHFLEQGRPQARFQALHGLERAVDGEAQRIDAARLRGEVLRAWSALWWRKFSEAAISPRTHAIMVRAAAAPTAEETVAAKSTSWNLPMRADAETPIPKAAGRFVNAVLALTSSAEDGDWVEIRRLGEAPSFARVAS
ncbi:MAG: hypothetical protein K0R38_2184 [Polyangiaceae bacterium]|nr:hypothetical protein [Polyangiaceae bacterium]